MMKHQISHSTICFHVIIFLCHLCGHNQFSKIDGKQKLNFVNKRPHNSISMTVHKKFVFVLTLRKQTPSMSLADHIFICAHTGGALLGLHYQMFSICATIFILRDGNVY